MLGVTFGGSILVAVRDLVRGAVGVSAPPSRSLVPFTNMWLNQGYDALSWAVATAPVLLAAYLLYQAGVRPRDLGLWRPRWRDGLAVVGLLAGIIVISIGVAAFERTIGHQGEFRGPAVVGFTALNAVLRSFNAGILEETVVLAYVVLRLERAGVKPLFAAGASLGVRTSYHLYYGSGVISPVLFGLLMTAYFLRSRRLLPVVFAHSIWDLWLSLPSAL